VVALTRVLRELVSNAIAHAKATHVAIDASLEHDVLTLNVIDNGCGRNPQAGHMASAWAACASASDSSAVTWSGGIHGPEGIACRVVIPHFVGVN